MSTQEKQVLDYVEIWAGSRQAAIFWYENEYINALGSTAKKCVESGNFDIVIQYLDIISEGGFA